MKLLSHSFFFTLSSFALLSIGCTGIVGSLERPEENKPADISVKTAALTPAHTCDNLLAFLKQDAIEKVDAYIDDSIGQWKYYENSGYDYDESDGLSDSNSAGPPRAGSKDSNASPGWEAGSTGDTQPPNDSERATEHSDTNTQVKGVDEADIVKNDGKFIYLLRGSNFVVLNAWPATELAPNYSFGIEGTPIEMFVRDSKQVVVYSRVDGAPIYETTGVKPRYQYHDNYGHYYDGGAGVAEPYYPGDMPGYYTNPLTKITVLQLQDNNEQPQVIKEVYFEGNYTSSRRMDSYVRTITSGASYGPTLDLYLDHYSAKSKAEWTAKWEKVREKNHEIINNSTLADWMPYYFMRTEKGIDAWLTQCENAYIPTVRSTNAGMTQLYTFNLDDITQNGPVTSIVGASKTVYANNETLVLGAEAWIHPAVWSMQWQDGIDGSVSVGSAGAPTSTGSQASPLVLGSSRQAVNEVVSMSYTHVHQFKLDADPLVPVYMGSNTVPGNIRDQFSIDVHKGFVRIATSDNRIGALDVNHLFIMQSNGRELNIVGSIEDLAPNEHIESARFLGDRGYIVTFRKIDPLFALDLADPTAPKVLGELKIPGFSNYMHPLDDNHLLTIGEGESRGLALQIFDVTDPVNPRQAHKYEFEAWSYSEAQNNHKAFTYFDSKKLLAFPMTGAWDNETGRVTSTLEVFDIDVTAGIKPRGSIDHGSFYPTRESAYSCYGYYTPEVRRGVFMDDFVYAISNGGVTVHNVNDLTKPVASLPFSTPVDTTCYYEDKY